MALAEKTQPPRQIDETDEVLWDEFKRDFLAAFTDTAREQDANNKLTNLSMQGRDIDSYIATFNNLAAKAGYQRSDKGTTNRFKRGLLQSLAVRILNQETPPVTLDGWQEAARKEILRLAQILADLGPDPRFNKTNQSRPVQRPNRVPVRGFPPPHQPPPPRPYQGPQPMDIDATRLGGALTDEEKRKLQQENKCFHCKIKGHVAKNCRKKAANKVARNPSTVAVGTITEEPQMNREVTDKEHIAWFQSHSTDEKSDLNDRILAEETQTDF